MSHLFDKLSVRGAALRNRIGVSPMCQYSSVEGVAGDWHLVHLGSRAVGGAGLAMGEGTAVGRRGRGTPRAPPPPGSAGGSTPPPPRAPPPSPPAGRSGPASSGSRSTAGTATSSTA